MSVGGPVALRPNPIPPGPDKRLRPRMSTARPFLFCLLTVNYSERGLLIGTAKFGRRMRRRGVDWSPISALRQKPTICPLVK